MADSTKIIPFILQAEGGYSITPGDLGGETNKGITYAVWCSVFGNDAHDRFMAMSNDDWSIIFKKLYWDKILGDSINSQRISDFICDWVWNSGIHFPEKDIQEILITSFGQHITADGCFGPATIASINSVDEPTEWADIIARRLQYYESIVAQNPSQDKFLQGWKNRVNNLVAFESQSA